MNRRDLAVRVNGLALPGMSMKDCGRAVDEVINGLVEALKSGEKVNINHFGKFEIKVSKPREGRNPQTGERISIPEKRRIKFTASPSLKDSLNT